MKINQINSINFNGTFKLNNPSKSALKKVEDLLYKKEKEHSGNFWYILNDRNKKAVKVSTGVEDKNDHKLVDGIDLQVTNILEQEHCAFHYEA